jgi:hypothetical protein
LIDLVGDYRVLRDAQDELVLKYRDIKRQLETAIANRITDRVEISRLEGEAQSLEGEAQSLRVQLQNAGFVMTADDLVNLRFLQTSFQAGLVDTMGRILEADGIIAEGRAHGL